MEKSFAHGGRDYINTREVWASTRKEKRNGSLSQELPMKKRLFFLFVCLLVYGGITRGLR